MCVRSSVQQQARPTPTPLRCISIAPSCLARPGAKATTAGGVGAGGVAEGGSVGGVARNELDSTADVDGDEVSVDNSGRKKGVKMDEVVMTHTFVS